MGTIVQKKRSPSRRYEREIPLSSAQTTGNELSYIRELLGEGEMLAKRIYKERLEREVYDLLGAEALAVSSGSAAVHLALKVAGVGSGDEVVAPCLTFVEAINPILYLGAKPVFIDSDSLTWTMDPELLAEFLGRRATVNKLPRAVMVTDVYGKCPDIDKIYGICRQYDLPLVEEASEAIGAKYRDRNAGALGDLGILSFNGSKDDTGSTGGILTARNKDMIEGARKLILPQNSLEYSSTPEIAYDYEMSEIIAAMMLAQLESLPNELDKRRRIHTRYCDELGKTRGVSLMAEAPYTRSSHWLTCLTVEANAFGMDASELMCFLTSANIAVKPVFTPMHMQPLFRGCEALISGVAERLHHSGLCLPNCSNLTPDEQSFVIEMVQEAHKANSKT
jgi:dTDP-4-amino-4,6-dideoxygalactose transaminase